MLDPIRVEDFEACVEFGVVEVIGGRFKGLVGFYDDDSDGGRRALVYFGEPLQSQCELIPHRFLRQACETLTKAFEDRFMPLAIPPARNLNT